MPTSKPPSVSPDTLATVIDAHRAEQRNAESRLSRLLETRDALVARGSEEARSRLEALDRDIATVTARVKQALRLQGELMLKWGQSDGEPARG
ncbi:MAG: hypothetical protein ACRYGP_26505 [Janthinobacterium lividum]